MFGLKKLGSTAELLDGGHILETHGEVIKIHKTRLYSRPMKSESLICHSDINS